MATRIRQVTLSPSPTPQTYTARLFEPPLSPPPSSPLPPIPNTPPYVHSRTNSPTSPPPRPPRPQVSLPELRPRVIRSPEPYPHRVSAVADLESSARTRPRKKPSKLRVASDLRAEDQPDDLGTLPVRNSGPIEPICLHCQASTFTEDVLAALPSPSLFSRPHKQPQVRPESPARNSSISSPTSTYLLGQKSCEGSAKKSRTGRPQARAHISDSIADRIMTSPNVMMDKKLSQALVSIACPEPAVKHTISPTASEIQNPVATNLVDDQNHRPQTPIKGTTYTIHARSSSSAARSISITSPVKSPKTLPKAHQPPIIHQRTTTQSPPTIPAESTEQGIVNLEFGFPTPPNRPKPVKSRQPRPSQELTSLPRIPSDADFLRKPPQILPRPPSNRITKLTRYLRFSRLRKRRLPVKSLDMVETSTFATVPYNTTNSRTRSRQATPRPSSQNANTRTSTPRTRAHVQFEEPESGMLREEKRYLKIRRSLWITLTVLFVLVVTGAVLGGIIWKLSSIRQKEGGGYSQMQK